MTPQRHGRPPCRVKGSGTDKHGALLQAHRPPTEDPGYPLTSFLDDGWVPSAGSLAPFELSPATLSAARTTASARTGARASALAAAAEASPSAAPATGRLTGRVVDPETRRPVASGQVVAAGNDDAVYTTVAQRRHVFPGCVAGRRLSPVRALVHRVGARRLDWRGDHGPGHAVQRGGRDHPGRGRLGHSRQAGDGEAHRRWRPRRHRRRGGAGRRRGPGGGRRPDRRRRERDPDRPAGHLRPGGGVAVDRAGQQSTVDLSATSSVALRLDPAAVVTATVRDEHGAPLQGVVGGAVLGRQGGGRRLHRRRGIHAFTGLEPGDYTVRLYEALQRFELPEVALPATAKIGDPSAGQVSYTLDQTTVAITSGSPPAEATVGEPYAFSFTASGSPAPTFSLASGRLPDGLTLDAAGKLSGAPTTAGTYTFSVTATNPAGTATGGPYTITVDAKPAITSGAPPAGSVGASYDFAFTASGAPAPSFALASGALPDGLALDQDGRLHGTPTREGRYTFSVSAQNRAGSATAGPYTMVIDVPLGVDQVVSFDRTTSATQLRSPAMAVSAGELVLAHVSADGPSSRRQRVTSLTGGGLRWSLAARSNDGRGTAEIWQAKTTQAISQLRVTAKLARYGYHGSITVASFKGRQVVGATSAAAAGSRGAPRVKLTPTRDRSLVWAAGHDSTRAQAPVPQPGQTIVHQFLDTRAKDTFWTQRLDGPASRGVPVRMGVSTPTRDHWQMVAVELAPTGG